MVKEHFILGDEWIYYSIYGGANNLEIILWEYVLPISEYLLNKELIDEWFFIRYNIPEHHLRIRFHVKKIENIQVILTYLLPKLEYFLNYKLCHNIEAGMYTRELNRYGKTTIRHAENIFYADSKFIVRFLKIQNTKIEEDLRWIIGGICIDEYLNLFDFDIYDKQKLLFTLKESFAKEFGIKRQTKKQIDSKYRIIQGKFNRYLFNWRNELLEHEKLSMLVEERSKQILINSREILHLAKTGKLEVGIESLVSSFIHMSMNRLFISNNRLNEAVLYDFMERQYKSSLMRKKYEKCN